MKRPEFGRKVGQDVLVEGEGDVAGIPTLGHPVQVAEHPVGVGQRSHPRAVRVRGGGWGG